MKCTACDREINVDEEGHFREAGLIYCEKCYANKRWAEVDAETKRKWREQVRILVNEIKRIVPPEERKKALALLKRKIPSATEDELKNE